MNWFKKLFFKGKYEVVYSTYGTWEVKYGTDGSYENEYCSYNILYNDVTKHYKLETSGYKPLYHNLYNTVFKIMRELNEGSSYVKGGNIYSKSDVLTDTELPKSVDAMNETECNIYLTKALEDENYELAEKIRKRLEKLQ